VSEIAAGGGLGWPLERLAALAEGSPESEVCGLLIGLAGAVTPWPMRNVAGAPATAFELDPLELLAALRRLDREGGELLAVYHSHLAGGADLSTRDLAGALADGSPVLPGVAQLVVALERGRADRIKVHRWSGARFVASEPWSRTVNTPLG
jgi:proteasome lid subunit RPN8/RPN11